MNVSRLWQANSCQLEATRTEFLKTMTLELVNSDGRQNHGFYVYLLVAATQNRRSNRWYCLKMQPTQKMKARIHPAIGGGSRISVVPVQKNGKKTANTKQWYCVSWWSDRAQQDSGRKLQINNRGLPAGILPTKSIHWSFEQTPRQTIAFFWQQVFLCETDVTK